MSQWRGAWAAVIVFAGGLAAGAAETRMLAGTVTNTTHGVSAPLKIELVIEGDKVTGWLTAEAPLQAGRWALEGVRKGAWCEVTCKQSPGTATQFRGVLSATAFRGTYVFGGNGELVQYGRFHVKVAVQKDGP